MFGRNLSGSRRCVRHNTRWWYLSVDAMTGKPVALFACVAAAAAIALLGWLAWPSGEEAVEAPPAAAVLPEPAAASAAASIPEVPTPPLRTETIALGKRDTLLAALTRHDVPSVEAHRIAAALRDAGANLRQVRPGDEIELSKNEQGKLVALAYAPTPWTRFEVSGGESGWQADRIDIEPEVRIEARQGEVRGSLWEAVDEGALSADVLLKLVEIFESEFDFTLDARPGDRFRLLVETRYAKGKAIDHGAILIAQYAGADGKTLTGVGFRAGKRFAYYDLEGRSLKRTFLRSPLQFTRISSRFTYRRPHPVLGGVRPHLAVDYAAPTGTPVWAVADGVVEFAGRRGGNGIQVLLRHRGGYKTYYNHLSRVARGIKRGVRVNQKQIIGFVGSTGLSTGPHLDYRVSYRGRFVNPLSEKFIPGDPVPAAQRAQFEAHARALVDQLEREAPLSL